MSHSGVNDPVEDPELEEENTSKGREESMTSYLKNKITSRGELNYSNNNLFYLPRAILMAIFEQVVILNISKNSFTEINESLIKSLPCLRELNAESNKITFVTSEIHLLSPSLKRLILGKNNLWEIPSEISQLKNLQYLLLNDNKIEYVPAEICELENLKMLDLSRNQISYLPYDLGNLKNIRRLNILNNPGLASKNLYNF